MGPTPSAQITMRNAPNIVLVMIDNLGAEAVGCYGGLSYSTPHMNALADAGMKCNHASPFPINPDQQ